MSPVSRLVTLRPGRELNVEVAEPAVAGGTTVFLVHGAGGRAEQWREVVPALLAAGHRVVRHDALGHGLSARPRRWRAYAGRELVADLQALVQRHGSARNVLVGHSYGTSIVLGALREGVAGIERVLLLAPPAPNPAPRALWLTYLPVPVLERLRPRLSAGFRAAAWGPDAPAPLVDAETAISDRNSLYVFKAQYRQRLAIDPASLSGITQPVQVLAGEADRLTPPDGARALVAALPRATLTLLPRCGHQILLSGRRPCCRRCSAPELPLWRPSGRQPWRVRPPGRWRWWRRVPWSVGQSAQTVDGHRHTGRPWMRRHPNRPAGQRWARAGRRLRGWPDSRPAAGSCR
jgi:abhydrolase domain-containing protein 8